MAAWRVARSLDQLLFQLNTQYPKRSKVSDGGIGDQSHSNRNSDHNPWYGPGIVTARDYTHDPKNGIDCEKLAQALVASRDPRIKYIIWNRRIIDSRPGNNPWKWMPYKGANGHTQHLHLSVMNNRSCDDVRPWAISAGQPTTEDDLSEKFEKEARARWAKEDALERDLRGDLHHKQGQIDEILTLVKSLKVTLETHIAEEEAEKRAA